MDDSRKRISRGAPGAVFPAAPRGASEHHPQLARSEYRRGLLRSGGRIRSAGAERLLGVDPGLSGRGAGSGAVSRQCARCDQPLSESSLDRGLVRAQRRAYRSRSSTKAWPISIATLDGTRYYTGSSNSREPAGQRTLQLPAAGTATSPDWRRAFRWRWERLPCRRSSRCGPPFRRPTAGRSATPIAYHDWHFGGNGDVATFMAALAAAVWRGHQSRGFRAQGAADGLRRSYRAIFEGFQAHLWTTATAAACCG